MIILLLMIKVENIFTSDTDLNTWDGGSMTTDFGRENHAEVIGLNSN